MIVGPGIGAWLLLASGAAGNWITAFVHGTAHRAVGASTDLLRTNGAPPPEDLIVTCTPRVSASDAPLIATDDGTQVVAAIDARHEHIYLQVFGVNGRTLVGPRVASWRDAARAAMAAPARIVGSAANKMAAAWPKGAEPPLSVEQRAAPDIEWIARLGAAATDGYSPPKPLYLREPDAQPQDAARLPRR